MNLIEKIISLHAGLDTVEAGMEIAVRLDRIFLREEDLTGGSSPIIGQPMTKGLGLTVVSFDQSIGSMTRLHADAIRAIRERARSERKQPLYDLGRGGIGTVIYPDGGWVRPGDLVAGRDPQLQAFGALGALSITLDEDGVSEAIRSGEIRLKVPETLRIVFRGTPAQWVGGKDLAIHLFGLLGTDSLEGKALELSGDGVERLDLPGRLAMAAFASNLGAVALVLEPDAKTRVFARARSDRPFTLVKNDPDARFADILEVDIESLDPQVYFPATPERVFSAARIKDMQVDQVVIGTGGNGRIEDIRDAAALIREHQVKKDLRLVLLPGSQQTFLHAMEEGLIQIFLRAGAHIGLPSDHYTDQCHASGAGEGERILTTSGRLYESKAEIAYCNPVVAAASAVKGHVVDPFEMFRTVKRAPTGLMG